jgi:Flp pilus assembly pilin Flp
MECNTVKIFKFASTFANDESGAVTVDWVVLTAAIVGLGIAVLASVSGGVTNLSGDIAGQLSSQTIAAY